jgi:hypothetical protein
MPPEVTSPPPGTAVDDWPVLIPADRCDGENPMTGRPCTNGHHTGPHRDATDAEWLDNGL